MTELQRSVYRLDRNRTASERALPDGLVIRPVLAGDDAALGALMERAYSGTVDENLGDNNDGAVEIAEWRAQSAMAAASFVVVDHDDQPLSAALLSHPPGEVWLSYVITDPAWKIRGLGLAAVQAALQVVRDTPGTEVLAGVTDGNIASERLLAAVGFVRVGPV